MDGYITLDHATKYEILRLNRQESLTSEELAELFGIPESLVDKVLLGKV